MLSRRSLLATAALVPIATNLPNLAQAAIKAPNPEWDIESAELIVSMELRNLVVQEYNKIIFDVFCREVLYECVSQMYVKLAKDPRILGGSIYHKWKIAHNSQSIQIELIVWNDDFKKYTNHSVFLAINEYGIPQIVSTYSPVSECFECVENPDFMSHNWTRKVGSGAKNMRHWDWIKRLDGTICECTTYDYDIRNLM